MSVLRYRLEQRLSLVTGLPAESVGRVACEVLDIFGLTLDEFIAVRQDELQQEGYPAAAIYPMIQKEVSEWRFKSADLSLRQIRRKIYG
ncbi:MAG: hypothetical protein JW797_09270 [Bradymonadales bacterium]|nr:hypothetical protein [Bradymonadales bacterium]